MTVFSSTIQDLECYQIMEPFKQKLLTKKANIDQINQAIIFYKTTGKINYTIGGSNVKLLQEIIDKHGIKPNVH